MPCKRAAAWSASALPSWRRHRRWLWLKVQKHRPNVKFQLVPFENTPESAREILRTLGKDIGVVAGVFWWDHAEPASVCRFENFPGAHLLRDFYPSQACAKGQANGAGFIWRKPDVHPPGLEPLCGSAAGRPVENHSEIYIIDFDFYNVSVFNQCENQECVLMAIANWRFVHPLLKIMRVDWNYTIPFGLLHSPNLAPTVERFFECGRKGLSHKEHVSVNLMVYTA